MEQAPNGQNIEAPLPPESATAGQGEASRKSKLKASVKVSIFLFGLAGLVVAYGLPLLFPKGGDTPNPLVFFFTGAVLIGLLAILFKFLSTLNLGFTRSALISAFGFNAAIILAKFVIAPFSLYQQNLKVDFNSNFTGFFAFALVAVTTFALYLIALNIIYSTFKLRSTGTEKQSDQKHNILIRLLWLICVAVILFVGLGLFLTLALGVGLEYLTYVFSGFGLAIVVALIVAVILAVMGFKEVRRQSLEVGDGALLASFFWLALSLLVVYHVLWVIYLLTLTTIWPFRTYTPK